MDIAFVIARFGYLAVLLGTMFEGETVLLLAGYAAHRGYLDLTAVIGVAWLGAALGDQGFFWLGRRHGARLLQSRPAWRGKIERALRRIERHPQTTILAMRFVWGLRMALPAALGMSHVHWQRFFWLNLLSAAVWAMLVAGIGWSFGTLIASHAAAWHRYEHWGMAGVLALAALAHGWQRRRTHAKEHT